MGGKKKKEASPKMSRPISYPSLPHFARPVKGGGKNPGERSLEKRNKGRKRKGKGFASTTLFLFRSRFCMVGLGSEERSTKSRCVGREKKKKKRRRDGRAVAAALSFYLLFVNLL